MKPIKCPYDKLTLSVATISALTKIETYIEKIGEEQAGKNLEATAENLVNLVQDNNACASFHKISVDTLVNSPNYETLKNEFQERSINNTILELEEKLELTNKEAWAILLINEVGLL